MLSHRYRVQSALALALILGAPVWLLAREQAQQQGPTAFHAQSQLVNLTITATDANGQPFKGLKASDVVVEDEGKPQDLLNFTPAVTQTMQSGSESTATSPSRAAREAAPSENQDYIALVMDDSTTGYLDLQQSLQAAEKWVREDMTSSDRVALLSISYGVKVWQPFTTDRDLLLAGLKAMVHQRPAEDLKERIDDLLRDPDFPCDPRGGTRVSGPARHVKDQVVADRWGMEEQPRLPDQISWLRTLVQMLGVFPGHKRVIYLGDGFLMNPGRFAAYVIAAYCGGSADLGLSNYPYTLHSVIDAATRAGVTFYTIDARGLIAEPLSGGAAENFPSQSPAFYMEKLHAPQDPLNELAHDTGGVAYNNGNDLTYFIRRAINSIEGTYYASYQPGGIPLNGLYHKITIHSLLPGVKVRTRGGYIARPVHEFPVRAEVLHLEKKEGESFLPVRITLDGSELQWHGLGSNRHDELVVGQTVEDSSGDVVANRLQVLDASYQHRGRLGLDVDWSLPPGEYTAVLNVTETDTSNFGSAVVTLKFPERSMQVAKPGRRAAESGETYVDLSPPELTKRVHTLKGIEPAKSQAELPEILDRVGKAVAAFFDEFPNTTCTETATVEVLARPSSLLETATERFNYLALAESGSDKTVLREYRTDSKGTPVKVSAMRLVMTTGFVGMLVHFHPTFQADSKFRYVGRQQMDGRDAYVVSFAQMADRAQRFVTIGGAGQSEKVLLQGVAWVDPVTYEILRMRTDMLKPRGPLNVQWLSTDVEYSEVTFEDSRLALWLPQTVKVEGQTDQYAFHNEQRYSNYLVFNVKTMQQTQSR